MDNLTSAGRIFNPGDEIAIRSVKSLENEFGTNEWGSLDVPYGMNWIMKGFCGTIATVADVFYDYVRILEDDGRYKWAFSVVTQSPDKGGEN